MAKKKNKKKNEVIQEVLVDSETDELDFLAVGEGELEAEPEIEETVEAAGDEETGDVVVELDASGLETDGDDSMDMAGTQLEDFESASIEDVEHLTEEQVASIVESVLFSTDKPVSVAFIKQAFKGTNVKSKEIREALDRLQNEYAEQRRGFTLEEVANGFQLRTKSDNMKYLRQSVKARPFRLSGPALEVLSIVAYKQPMTKSQIDEIRGVESGHLLRALMEKHIITFGERSDLPGKPMFYETTRKFLEIFGLRNLQELPSLNEIDQLIPDGIGDEEDKETLGDLTHRLSQQAGSSYSEGEEELIKITDELSSITTSSDFFEAEKQRMKEQKEKERAQDIREALAVGEQVDDKDVRWLERYELAQQDTINQIQDVAFVTEGLSEAVPETVTAEAIEAASDDRAFAAGDPELSEVVVEAFVTEEVVADETSVSDLAASAASAMNAFNNGSEPEPEAGV
jgi:segregation and condensation protein B